MALGKNFPPLRGIGVVKWRRICSSGFVGRDAPPWVKCYFQSVLITRKGRNLSIDINNVSSVSATISSSQIGYKDRHAAWDMGPTSFLTMRLQSL
jgi:hypothetical protein